MSQPAVSWVIENSPYEGALFLVHIVVADTVDDREELRVSQRWLSRRAKVHRRTTETFVRRALKDGYLEETGPGPRRSMNYRLVRSWEPDGPGPLAQSVHHSNGATGAVSAPMSGAPLVHNWRSTGTPGGTRSGAVLAQSDSHSSSSSSSTSVSRAPAHAREAPAAAAGVQPQTSSSKKDETPTAVQPGFYRGLDVELGAPADALDPDRLKELIALTRRPPEKESQTANLSEAGDDDGKHQKGSSGITPLRPLGEGNTHPQIRRDRLADRLYLAVEDADYAAALKAVKKLRAAGVPDEVILKAATAATEAGATTLDYVTAIARSWGGRDEPQDPPVNGNGHVNGVA